MSTEFGVTTEPPKGPCCDDKPKGPRYPTVRFSDEQADRLIEALGRMPEVGAGVEFDTCEFEVCSTSDNEWGKSIELKLKSVGDISTEQKDEQPEKEKPPAAKSGQAAKSQTY